ncbi:MAG: PilZ domain-containing protein, partial [Oxalobacteraceae bacterium]
MQNSAPAQTIDAEERRRFSRVAVDLLGRFMLENRTEFPCRVDNMSPGDVSVVTPITPAAGERVILYVDHIGRIEGDVTRGYAGGFAMTVQGTDRKREKLAAQLTWLANR